MNDYYPKVLVIGNTFHTKSGGGITMTNLFRGWPKDKLAVATPAVHMSESDICEKYYVIGDEEEYRPWPFSLLRIGRKSGEMILSDKKLKPRSKKNTAGITKIYLKLNQVIRFILRVTGLYYFVYQLKISDKFLEWFNLYDPDIIYAQVSKYELLCFINGIKELTGTPLIIHVMDDHINNINPPNLLYRYWEEKIENEFRRVLDNSNELLSICESMSNEYGRRYNKKFIPFHNPVDLNNWLKNSKNKYDANGSFKIFYAGRIGIGTQKSIFEIAEVVDELNSENIKVKFCIQHNMPDENIVKKLRRFKNITLLEPVEYSVLPEILSTADMLILPMDFEEKGLRYIKYSMPTKTSEYMATGVPILVYASEQTALSQYAIKESWAYVVSTNERKILKDSIKELYLRRDLREQLGKRAKSLAIKDHNASEIRKKFKETLCLN